MKTQLDMTEIAQIPPNGYNVISTFSGCGGSSLGYKLSGYKVKCAVEFIPNAAETYSLNFPDTPVLQKDIREVTGEELLTIAGLKKFELDILDGSPPCCDFSINGKRELGWGKVKKYSSTEQRVDDLFFEYARLVKDIMPKVFVAENTKGLTLGKARAVLKQIMDTLTDIGYNVSCKVVDTSKWGIPQKRERLIIVGVRKDLRMFPVFPLDSYHGMTTEEAIGDLIDNGTDQVNDSIRDFQMKEYFRPGCSSADIKRICKLHNLKVYEQSYRRDKWDKPYYTIKQHHTRPYHPIVDRLMSIDEAKRLQTFPDDFILPHSPTQNWERIGRAVPPTMMHRISKTIQIEILDKLKENTDD